MLETQEYAQAQDAEGDEEEPSQGEGTQLLRCVIRSLVGSI